MHDGCCVNCARVEERSPLCPHKKKPKKKVNNLDILGGFGMTGGKQGQQLGCGAVPIRWAASAEQGLAFAQGLCVMSWSQLRWAGICCRTV